MDTSPTTSLSKPTGAEPIPKGTLGYLRSRNRHRLSTVIIREFKKSGLTQADLARRAGKPPETICRWLATPGNMRADSLSDLLFSISGAVPTYGLDYPLERPARNDTQPEWFTQPKAGKKSADVPKSKIQQDASSVAEANAQNILPPPIGLNTTARPGISSTSTAHRYEQERGQINRSAKSLMEANA